MHPATPDYFLSPSRIFPALFIFILMWVSAPDPAYPQALVSQRSFTVVLDPGHDPEHGGAWSATGIKEVVYNDNLAEAIKQELETMDALHVVLTRTPDQNLGLHERARLANEHKADLFISVHHDSAQKKYLKTTGDPEHPKVETILPIQGYSLFVSRENGDHDHALEFARRVGKEMRRMGRYPSLHHAEKIAGENRPLIDPELGIYRFDELLVLKETKMPALLIEAGVIVDPSDEKFVSAHKNIKQLAQALKRAVAEYIEHLGR